MKTIIAILLLFLCSCGTHKTSMEERNDIRREETPQLRAGSVMGITISDSIGEKLRRERVYKITILSAPDSLGRQWPVTIEEGTVTEDYAGGRLLTKDSTAVSGREVQRRHNDYRQERIGPENGHGYPDYPAGGMVVPACRGHACRAAGLARQTEKINLLHNNR